MDYRWLVSDRAVKWLELAATTCEPTLKLAARLRKELTADETHLVIEQAALRRRAVEKFSLAARMFFTPTGLEQATDEWIAAYKAERFPRGNELVDLCCGVGGDLIALAGRGPAVGVDREPVAGLLAAANLAACRATEKWPRDSLVRTADVGQFDVRAFGAWHLDPDRRPTGRRTTRVVAHDPPPEVIERLLADCPNAAIKLAPAAELPDGWSNCAELEWISRKRECRQLVAWFGVLAGELGHRSATILDGHGRGRRTIRGMPDTPIETAPHIGLYVFEPDPAVLAAKLTGALASERALSAITPGIAYLTGDEPLDDAALGCFEVLDLLPLRTKVLKVWLEERGIGRLEVKKRGVDIDPEKLRGQLQFAGEHSATLLITRVGGRTTVIAARRVKDAQRLPTSSQ